jgi:hypothetical protein
VTGSRWERTESLLAEDERKKAERAELSIKNRRVLAERMDWPDGDVEECEKLDGEYPGCYASFFPRNAGWSKIGWYATLWRSHHDEPKTLYGTTFEELRSALLAEADREQ